MMHFKHQIAFSRIVYKEHLFLFRFWLKAFLGPIVFLCMYFVIFSTHIGKYIGIYAGFPYVLFITPGLITLIAANGSYTNGSLSFFNSRHINKTLQEFLVSPTPLSVLVSGYLIAAISRGIVLAVLGITIAYFWFLHVPFNPIEILITIIAISSLFGILGMINGILSTDYEVVSFVRAAIITPAAYLGGIFYLPSYFPMWAQYIVYANPFFYCTEIARHAMLGTHSIPLYISWLVVLSCIGLAILSLKLALIKVRYFKS